MKKEQMINKMKRVRNALLLVVAFVILGALGMTLAYMLPVDENSSNVRESLQILEDEGYYPIMPYVWKYNGDYAIRWNDAGRLDNYSDGIMISTSAVSAQGNKLFYAMDVKGYSYYWHGYVTILRPLLLFFHYGEIRMLNVALQIFLIVVLALLLYNRKGKQWSFWILSIYLMLFPAAMGLSLQYSWVFYISVVSLVVLLRWEDFFKKNHRIYYLFLIAGMLTSFFDLLTYPLFTWGILMITWVILNDSAHEKKALKEVVICGLYWILGYGGMWGGKWILGNIILHRDIIAAALSEILVHTTKAGSGRKDGVPYFDTLTNNLNKAVNVATAVVLLIWIIWFGIKVIQNRGKLYMRKCLPLSLVGCSAFVWYFVLRNHTNIHAAFTYRIYVIAWAAFIAALIYATDSKTPVLEVPGKIAVPILTAMVIVSLFLSVQYKTEYWRHNGEAEAGLVAMAGRQYLSETIEPMYCDIASMNLGITAEGVDGEFSVELYRDEDCIYSRTIPYTELTGTSFYEIPIDLKVRKKEITLFLTARDGEDSKGYFLFTEDQDMLPECSNLISDGEPLNGKMTQGITYLGQWGKIEFMNNLEVIFCTLAVFAMDILSVIWWTKDKTYWRKKSGQNSCVDSML